jgi:hypothetical protein
VIDRQPPPQPSDTHRANAMVCRLSGALGLTAAALFLGLMAVVLRLPVLTADGGHANAYAIPGTARAIDAAIVPVLGTCGGVAALVGVIGFVLGSVPAGIPGAAKPEPTRRPARSWSARPLLWPAIGATALAAVLLLKR